MTTNVKQNWLFGVLEPKQELPKSLKILAVFLALLIINNVFSLSPNLPSMVQYLAIISVNGLIILLVGTGSFRVCLPMWLFWGMMWLSIVMNIGEIPAYFKSSQRTLFFLLTLLIAGPWFLNELLAKIRQCMFDVLNLSLLIMAVLSFLGKMLHFLPSDKQGFYLGCTYHSMNLGALAGIAVVYSMHRMVQSWQNVKLTRLFAGFCLASLLTVFLSCSRTCVISSLIAMLIYFCAGEHQKIRRVIKPVIVVSVLTYFTAQMLPAYFEGLLKKSSNREAGITVDSLTYSRMSKWTSRIEEIKQSPIFGVGAHTVRLDDNAMNGQIEPGNAWLYIFSSMGIFAFVLFGYMVFEAIMQCRPKAKPGQKECLVVALLVFFSLYMMGEAHVTSAGEFTCFYFWLLLGIAIDSGTKQPLTTSEAIHAQS